MHLHPTSMQYCILSLKHPKTNLEPQNGGGWKTSFLFLSGWFSGEPAVSSRGSIVQTTPETHQEFHLPGPQKIPTWGETSGTLLALKSSYVTVASLSQEKKTLPTWSLTASFPLKSDQNPKGKACLPTIICQGQAVKLQECNTFHWILVV